MKNRNHEGYHDPTACIAIRRADQRQKEKTGHLMYLLKDAAGFRESLKILKLRG